MYVALLPYSSLCGPVYEATLLAVEQVQMKTTLDFLAAGGSVWSGISQSSLKHHCACCFGFPYLNDSMHDFFWSLLKPQSYFDLAVHNITFSFFPWLIINLRLFENVSIGDTGRRTCMLDHPGWVLRFRVILSFINEVKLTQSLYLLNIIHSPPVVSVFSHAAWPLEQSWMMFVCKTVKTCLWCWTVWVQ